MKTITLKTTFVFCAVVFVIAFLSLQAYAIPADRPLSPATRYSGRTPIDITNGILFNNGTYGLPNQNYEKWAQAPLLEPGLSDLNYPFNEREDFIAGCEESISFVDSAIFNWRHSSAITKPEVKEYAEKSAALMQPLLDRLIDATSQAKSASKNDWDKAQADARHALTEMRATYSSLHKNVH